MGVKQIGSEPMVASVASSDSLDTRQLLRVLNAVKRGDFSVRMSDERSGIAGKVADTLNDIIEINQKLVKELERISTVVGKEGQIVQRALIPAADGGWMDCLNSVNTLITDLVQPTAEMARVIRAVARGDLSQTIAVEIDGRPLKGEFLQTAKIVNTMVDQLNSFASEVTRVAREVGTEGKLGGQAKVEGVAGVWRDLTDNVNSMANNLSSQVRNIADVTTAVANGDLSKKITVDVNGEILELKNTINTMVDQLNSFASEVTRVAREVGTEGKLGGQATVQGVAGVWKDLTDNVNLMASNLTAQVRNIADVTTAVANGDLSKKITVDVKGEILELKNTINTMVDQLNSFASEVTRVAREVGTEGKLGGQAEVQGVAGLWKDLTDNVNSMASNLTAQVRGIARVVTAVANGDLKQKLALEVKGEIATLADTINEMIDTLATFADQVTTVAREVGIEGKLGGQANVPNASGTWKDLTDNVNQLAASLTTQLRAIAEVATAVTKGDLTRSITVGAQGEVAELKDNINQMIANLRETTRKNTEQDWLKTNLAKFTRMLQGQRELETVAKQILSELAPLVSAQHGVFYLMDTAENGEEPVLTLLASYAYKRRKHLSNQFHLGEGLVGQCALEKERILLEDVPQDYIKISSGLGEGTPINIVVLPVLFEGQVTAVIELASFYHFSDIHVTFLEQLTESIGIVLNTIGANMRTEKLLAQSQSLAEELQNGQRELTDTNKRLEQQAKSLQASEELLRSQQEELKQTNDQLEEKARLLAEQNSEVEHKNREIEHAKRALEEKAEQLALTSKYKSEFLANMSHELRTPLNSMLILSKLLAENPESNLSGKQVQFAQTIYSSGADLLSLINDILDLAKIESGTMAVNVEDVRFTDLRDDMERDFGHIAQSKELDFAIDLDPALPRAITTDTRRLQQVLRNLLSNACKFTEHGSVRLSMSVADREKLKFEGDALQHANTVIAFAVQDTGIGIPAAKQKIVFEAFQQADGTTSRKYGGTGLGLSISREIASLLGGELRLISTPDEGSTFTLYLPLTIPRSKKASGSTPAVPVSAPPASHVETSTAPSPEPAVTIQADPPLSDSSTETLDFADDRDRIHPGDRVLLIVEDDPVFAQILLNVARDRGFKGLVTMRGDIGLELARQFEPAAIILDILLPGMDGWTVMDRLKQNPRTRDIPINVVTGVAEEERAVEMGALTFLRKPVNREALIDSLSKVEKLIERPMHELLIVEDNDVQRNSIAELLGREDVRTTLVESGEQALAALRDKFFDCIVLDLDLPDISGIQVLRTLEQEEGTWDYPVIVYTGLELSPEDEQFLRRVARSIIMKRDVTSLEHLLADTDRFLHRVTADLPPSNQAEGEHVAEPLLAGKKVLIVDDDIRNIFATTSILERHEMQVVYAENGQAGINLLQQTPHIDLVLMDIMMPEMDGYETMRRIRAIDQFKSLPIIALTAKAMKGDREKCLEAGASDYIPKPVDTEQLLALMRAWV
jgi:CheY-like chemotaxis protein/signal transduction histidine kinase/HAMP domain-containing protein